MDIDFEPVERNTVSEEIIKQLISLINTGKLRPGSKLPSERELMEKFQVSRSSVREALHSLTTIGLLETYPGAGTFVSKQLGDIIGGQLEWSILLGNHELQELIEVREPLEVQAAGLAAQRNTPESSQVLREAIQQYASVEQDYDRLMDAECEVHMTIVNMSGNHMLARIILTFENMLREYRKKRRLGFSTSPSNVEEYYAILKAIENSDENAARAEMMKHLHKSKQKALVDQINEHSDVYHEVEELRDS